jgi:anti-sigma B factor antagonist
MSVRDPDQILETELESNRDGVVILRLAGEVDLSSAPLLAAKLEQLATEGTHDVVVDATRVTFMDSTGLHALVEGKRAIHQHDINIYLVPSDQVRRVLELVFPDRLFANRLDTVDEALRAIDNASSS